MADSDDIIGVFRPDDRFGPTEGAFYLRDSNTTGIGDVVVDPFGDPSWILHHYLPCQVQRLACLRARPGDERPSDASRGSLMRPDDLGRFRTVSDPQLHPDGVRVAFVVSRMDLVKDHYERQIWLWDGQQARRFTAGPGDLRPRWSPDGSRLAFLRRDPNGETKRFQLYVMPVDGGEPWCLTRFELGADEAEWSPDGRSLAVIGKSHIGEWADLDDEERRRRPVRVTRARWRRDNEGWWYDRTAAVYVAPADGSGEPRLLTPGDFNHRNVAWHPDGDRVAVMSPRHERRGLEPGEQAFEIPVEGGDAKALTDVGGWSWVGYDPAGRPVVYGRPDPWAWPGVPAFFHIDDGSLTDLTGKLDRDPMPYSPVIAPLGPQWVEGGFVTTLEDDGRLRVIRVDDSGEVADVVGGDRLVTGIAARPDGGAVAFTATAATDPGELWWWENGEERVLTSLNEEFRVGAGLIAPEPLSFDSDGVEIHGWAYLPPGGERLPLLLNIHGGPAAQYGVGFFDEFQMYAGAGYGVVACNPRGSSGRGEAYVRAVVGEWHRDDSPDMRDLEACVAAALERFPRLDPDRIGVMGGSYGGYATTALLTRDQRYGSAVVERALTTFPSFFGTADIGPWFAQMYLEANLPDGAATLAAASPLAKAHRITTPTLVLHSEEDWRCPIEQGEQLFTLLQYMGVETEMVRFPGESHELSRSGKPKHRRERFEIILGWHARYLQST